MIEEDFWSAPNSWSMKKFEDVSKTVSGKAFDSSRFSDENKDGYTPVVRIRDIHNTDTESYTDQDFDSKYKVESGDLLVGMDGSFEASFWKGGDSALNQRVLKIKSVEEIKIEWIKFWLDIILPYIHSRVPKATVKHLSVQKHLNSSVLPVPPLNEQERIVEAVEERLERVERLEKSVEGIGRLAEEYEDSLLSYVFTGRSFNQEKMSDGGEWFKQIPENWEVRELGEIGRRISSMTDPESGKIYSLYSFDSVDDGSGYYEVDGGEIGSRKRKLSGGEVMISRLNPRINRVQKIETEHEHPPIASSEFVAIDVENYVTREYLHEYLRNPILRKRLINHVTGSTGSRARVGFDFVMDSRIPVPPKNEQEEIVEKIRNVDFDILEKSYSDVSTLFAEYRDSVLSHAFQGEMNC